MPKTEVPAALPGGKPPGAKPKQGKKKVFLGFLVFLLVAAGGGGAAYWKFFMSAAPAEASAGTDTNSTVPAKDAHGMPEDPGLVAFEPFLVNLADEGSQSYLRVTLSLLVASEEEAKTLEARPVTLTRIRSTLLEVLATQTAAVISTADGKTELKQTIKNKTLELGIEVYDVLFSDFVVQY